MPAFKEYFRFNKAERVGIIVLVVLIILVLLSPTMYSFLFPPKPIDFELVEGKIKQCFASDTLVNKVHPDSLFAFNPNKLSAESWKKLGLKDYQIRMIKNFEAKGGRFYNKEDLKRIYAINAFDYKRLEPYITIQSEGKIATVNSKSKTVIELNSADSLQLLSLTGIGPAFASRIIKYRKLLGGFIRTTQLLEVYGMDEARFKTLSPLIIVDSTVIKKMNINTILFKELMRHPYVGYENAKRIMTYKRQERTIQQISELYSSKVLPANIYHKLLPYLAIK